MLTSQLQALPEELAQGVLESLSGMLGSHSLQNPVGWLLAVLKRAREEIFIRRSRNNVLLCQPPYWQEKEGELLRNQFHRKHAEPISAERLSGIVAGLRASLRRCSAMRSE